MKVPLSVEWIGDATGFLRILDQTLLPREVTYRDCRAPEEVWRAIKELAVRGAPAIGVAAAYGVVLGVQPTSGEPLPNRVRKVAESLKTSRPTAVNLFWALDRMIRFAESGERTIDSLLREAHAIRNEDAEMCRAMGAHGSAFVPDGGGVLTHCNTGGLATAEYGTALAVIVSAWEQGKRFHVFMDETRPLLQGARLTAWELQQHQVDCTLICDGAAASVMRGGKVQMIVVGADRIAANGDAANKIGTYSLAVLAMAHNIPFFIAAPSSTFDMAIASGVEIPIEERNADEITHVSGVRTAPDGVRAFNPAFDVTPAELIAGIITERGVIRPVNRESVKAMIGNSHK